MGELAKPPPPRLQLVGPLERPLLMEMRLYLAFAGGRAPPMLRGGLLLLHIEDVENAGGRFVDDDGCPLTPMQVRDRVRTGRLTRAVLAWN